MEELQQQMKVMQSMMSDMKTNFDKELKKRDDEHATELQELKLQLSSKSSNDKQDEKDFQKNVSEARDAIPQLSIEGGFPGTYPEFNERFKALLLIQPKFATFFKQVKVTDQKLPEDLDELKKLVPAVASTMTPLSLSNLFTLLRSKVASDSKAIYDTIPDHYPKDVQLMLLYTNIMQMYGRNDDVTRDLAHRAFSQLSQDDKSFDSWVHVVKKAAEHINTLYQTGVKGYSGTDIEKVDKGQVWGRIRLGLNDDVAQLVSSELTAMDTNGKPMTLSEKVNVISTKLTSLGLLEQQYQSYAGSTFMARTTAPAELKNKGSEYFHSLVHGPTMKELNPCFSFDGRPGSCRFAENCRFAHIQNPRDRAAALKKFSMDRRYDKLTDKGHNKSSEQKEREKERKERDKERKEKERRKRDKQKEREREREDSEDDSDSEDDRQRRHRRKKDRKKEKDRHYINLGKAYIAKGKTKQRRYSDSSESSHSDDYASFKKKEIRSRSSRSRRDRRHSKSGSGSCGLLKGKALATFADRPYGQYSSLATDDATASDATSVSSSVNDVTSGNDYPRNYEITSRRMKRKQKNEQQKLKRHEQSERDRRIRIQKEIEKQEKMDRDILKQERIEKTTEQRKNIKKQQKKAAKAAVSAVDSGYNCDHEDTSEGGTAVSDNEPTEEEKQIIREIETDFLNKRKKKKAKKKKKKEANYNCKATIFALLQLLAIALVSVSGVAKLGGESFTKYVGFGFVPQNQASSMIHIDNSTMNMCYMARKGRGPGDHVKRGSLRVIDGGSTWHLSGEKDIWVGKRKQLSRPKTIYGFDSATNNGGVVATESGTIEIPSTRDGYPTKIRVKNVLYVPSVGNTTLLSQGCLDDERHKFTVAHGVTSCYNNRGALLWQAHKRDGLYQLDVGIASCLLNKQEAHVKFGHINDKALESLGDFDGKRSS
jgi:hypothetical protein